jgi:hypothetical protein
MLSLVITLTARLALAAPSLLIYSDEPQPAYLGCLNCDSVNSDSVWNSMGKYGNKFGAGSIWNSYGKYGSPYSKESVCNAYTSSGPKVVDSAGNYYGRLTKNKFAKDALRDAASQSVIAAICGP